MLAGIEENQLKTGKHKVTVKYFPGARTDDMHDHMNPLLWKLSDYIILHIGRKDAFDNTPRETFEKILSWKRIYGRNYRNAKSLFQHQLNDTTMRKHH